MAFFFPCISYPANNQKRTPSNMNPLELKVLLGGEDGRRAAAKTAVVDAGDGEVVVGEVGEAIGGSDRGLRRGRVQSGLLGKVGIGVSVVDGVGGGAAVIDAGDGEVVVGEVGEAIWFSFNYEYSILITATISSYRQSLTMAPTTPPPMQIPSTMLWVRRSSLRPPASMNC